VLGFTPTLGQSRVATLGILQKGRVLKSMKREREEKMRHKVLEKSRSCRYL
jgi:hypothetical protein